METELGITLTTVSSMEIATHISNDLIQTKLAACVQLDQINSVYIWNDEIQQEEEIRMMIKHPIEKQDQVRIYLSQNHPYDTPEILSMRGLINQLYREWCSNWCQSD